MLLLIPLFLTWLERFSFVSLTSWEEIGGIVLHAATCVTEMLKLTGELTLTCALYLVSFLFNEQSHTCEVSLLDCIHIKKKRYTLASVTAPPRRTTLMFTSCAFLSTSRFTLPSAQWSEWWVYFGGKKLVSTSCFMISGKTHWCWAF